MASRKIVDPGRPAFGTPLGFARWPAGKAVEATAPQEGELLEDPKPRAQSYPRPPKLGFRFPLRCRDPSHFANLYRPQSEWNFRMGVIYLTR